MPDVDADGVGVSDIDGDGDIDDRLCVQEYRHGLMLRLTKILNEDQSGVTR